MTPGASDMVEAIETPETLERSEADETVEILEGIRDETRSASDTRTEDPSKQLQDELALLAMARGDQPSLPPLDKGERIKPVRVKYEVLSELNVRLWKMKIRGLLML
jgi:hypothetical protein